VNRMAPPEGAPYAAALAAALLVVAAVALHAQSPVINAVVERRPAPQSIAREIQTITDRGTPAWVGYRVPILRRTNASPRTSDFCCGRCRLEPPTELVVLARVEARQLVEVRPVLVDCDIDAAGMPLVWFDGVSGADSVRWLESLVGSDPTARPSRMSTAALRALGYQAEGIPRLIELARSHRNLEVRRQAFNYLGQSNDPRAMAFLSDILLK